MAKDNIATLREKITALEIELRAMRRVIEIAPADAVERACRALASGPEPHGYEARRLVLEGLLELPRLGRRQGRDDHRQASGARSGSNVRRRKEL